jgi:hypothetical protein
VSDRVLIFPRLPKAAWGEWSARVALRFRPGYAEDRVSERELEAIGPVLPELMAELMTLMALDSERE